MISRSRVVAVIVGLILYFATTVLVAAPPAEAERGTVEATVTIPGDCPSGCSLAREGTLASVLKVPALVLKEAALFEARMEENPVGAVFRLGAAGIAHVVRFLGFLGRIDGIVTRGTGPAGGG